MSLVKLLLNRAINLPIATVSLVIIKVPIFNKYKLHLLSTWKDQEKRNNIDNFLFRVFFAVWMRFEYLKEPNPDRREILKGICMGGDNGVRWAKFYQNQYPYSEHRGTIDLNAKIGNMTLKKANPIYDEMSAILSNTGTHYLVIQIGSSSGREIAYFAKEFPTHEFIGTDIYEEVVQYAGQFHNLPNLSFSKCSAKDIKTFCNHIDSTDREIIFFSIGGLSYVQPEHLTNFFDSIGTLKGIKVLSLGGADEAFLIRPGKLKTSIHRGNFSYTHDYKWYAEKSGIKTVKCEVIRPYYPYKDFPMYENTISYYYYGKTKQL